MPRIYTNTKANPFKKKAKLVRTKPVSKTRSQRVLDAALAIIAIRKTVERDDIYSLQAIIDHLEGITISEEEEEEGVA